MANPIWPSSLPQAPLLDSYSEKYTTLAQAVTTGNKSILVRRNSTRAQDKISVSFNLTKEQVGYFERFYYNTLAGGTLRFSFIHPRTKSVIDVSFDPTSDNSFSIEPNGSMRNFVLTLQLIIWN